jgi:hypothetical protein
MSRRLCVALCLALAAFACSAASAQASFGLKEFDTYFAEADGSPALQAGSHPYELVTSLALNTVPGPPFGENPDEEVKDIEVELPAGFAGDPSAMATCPTEDFVRSQQGNSQTALSTLCPDNTAIGEVTAEAEKPGSHYHAAVYNLEAGPGEAAKFGFVVFKVPIFVSATVSPEQPHNIIAKITNVSQVLRFYGSKFILWGNPSDPSHDSVRGNCVSFFEQDHSYETPSRGTCPVSTPETAFLTMPRSCVGPISTVPRLDSWQHPGVWVEGPASVSHDNSNPPQPVGMTGCGQLGFAPHISASPTASSGESPSGLNFNLDIKDEGLTKPGSLAQSDIKKAVVTLPEGVSLNPSAAEGLVGCTPADIARESVSSLPGEGCPQASTVGNVEVETPLLEGKLIKGSIYVAQSDDPTTSQPGAENPFDSLIAIYMVIKDPELGILVKLPGKVEVQEGTGQLVTTFDEIPQFPFAHFRFHFHSGERAPLMTPRGCGTYTTKALFTPWARPNEPYATSADFTITSGPNGGACQGGSPRFSPGFEAGTISNSAGSYSPFTLRVIRNDGEAELTRFSTVLPPGMTGKLAGIARCGDNEIAAAAGKTGRQELASPSCPPGSLIGHVLAGAGVGPALTWVPGTVYLSGPYMGAPFSVVVDTPAVAGPFDLGNVVIREPLQVDPFTAQVSVDGSAVPIPRVLKGIPLRLRDLRINVDRPNFTLNPTNCNPKQVNASAAGTGPAPLLGPETLASMAVRFQASNCQALGFKPKLQLELKGSTKHAGHPALRAVVTYPKKGAYSNIARAQVNLPHSEFIEQNNLNKTCTKPVLLEGKCPKTTIYGKAKAWTPLLDKPVQGNVYLVGGFGYKLPALVAELSGEIRVLLKGKVDSGPNEGIRNTFEAVPDAPVEKFVLEMKGGPKYSLLINSENLCKKPQRAIANFTAQNGTVLKTKPLIANDCGKGKKKSKGKKSKK